MSSLRIIDISNPTSPALAGRYDSEGEAFDFITISGNYAYGSGKDSSLRIIDISNPSSPALAGAYDLPGLLNDLTVSGNYAYVSGEEFGFQIIDISNPASPALAGVCKMPGYARAVAVSGNYAYVADYMSGIPVLDVSDPANITLVKYYYSKGKANDLVLHNDYLYSAGGWAGLSIIELDKTGAKPGESFLVARDFSLEQRFPNPFIANSKIHYNIPGPADAYHEISLDIYSLRGRLIRALYAGSKQTGSYSVVWDGRNDGNKSMPSGYYFSNLKVNNELQDTRKIILRR
jgi:hypothetical protein